jgi:hypothetical protein
VAAGVYSDAQAARGATEYDTQCSSCHNPDLSGGTAPPLKEARFARDFAGKDLTVLYSKILKTMPRSNPGSLDEDTSLDLVAHVLKENGFAAGQTDLTVAGLEGVQIVAGNPSRRRLQGFFLRRSGGLPDRRAAEHVASDSRKRSRGGGAAGRRLGGRRSAEGSRTAKASGVRTITLLDAMAYSPDAHKGHKMSVRGLLVKLPDEQRMTISSITMVAPACSE